MTTHESTVGSSAALRVDRERLVRGVLRFDSLATGVLGLVSLLAAQTEQSRGLRDTLARGLLVLAAVGALFAVATGVEAVATASLATRVVEFWRAAGLAVFAGLFLLLAFRPRHYAGVWELVILNKLALATFGLTVPADESATLALVDGALAVILVGAYVLARGWRAWQAVRPVAAERSASEGQAEKESLAGFKRSR